VASGSGSVDHWLDVVEPELDVDLVDLTDVAEQSDRIYMLQQVLSLKVPQAGDEQLQIAQQ